MRHGSLGHLYWHGPNGSTGTPGVGRDQDNQHRSGLGFISEGDL